jgi:hypothetical protein
LTTLGLDKVVVVHASYPFFRSSPSLLRFSSEFPNALKPV